MPFCCWTIIHNEDDEDVRARILSPSAVVRQPTSLRGYLPQPNNTKP